jgi:hypothetical protein
VNLSISESHLSPELYFSYSQFLVYDKAVESPGLSWTRSHFLQGFARQNSTVCFGTLLEHGTARVEIKSGGHTPCEYERVIAVPSQVISGEVIVEGPEKSDIGRQLTIPPGQYRLIAAQSVINDDDKNGEERIALYFESTTTPLEKSQILVADDELNPSQVLVESAEIP